MNKEVGILSLSYGNYVSLEDYMKCQSNWNELKEWLENEKPTKDMNENFIMIRLSDLKNKMQELESRK